MELIVFYRLFFSFPYIILLPFLNIIVQPLNSIEVYWKYMWKLFTYFEPEDITIFIHDYL